MERVNTIIAGTVCDTHRRFQGCDPGELCDGKCGKGTRSKALFAVIGSRRRVGHINMAVKHPMKSAGDLTNVKNAHRMILAGMY
jgi:hypothetical protein